MKKLLLFLILLVQVSWSQTPIYQWDFNSSLTDTSNSFTFASFPNMSGGYTTDRFGNANSAYNTPPGNNVELRVSGLTNLPQGSSARTLSVWMKFNAAYTSDIGIFEYGTQANSQVCGLTQQGNNQSVPNSLKAYGFSNDFTSPSHSARFNFGTTNTEWYHYVLTFDLGVLKVYRNGNLLIEQNNVTWNTQGNTLRLLSAIATNLGSSSYYVVVDDLKIYNTVLSQTQIEQMYQSEFPVSTNGLIAYFPFNNSYNATLGNYAFAPVNSGTLSYITGAKGQGVNISNSNALANGGGYGSGDLADDLATDNITVSYWMRRNANATNAFETSSEIFGSMYFRDRPASININQRKEFGLAYGTNSGTFYSNSTFFNENLLNKWIHVAQVFFKEGTLRYVATYINGELIHAGYVAASPLYKFNTVIALGGGTDSGGNFMLSKYANIAIDEVMYFNRALSFPEILSLRYYEPASCPTGNVTLTTQAEVDALASCTTISGNLTINGGGNALNLTPLNNMTSITGTLLITGVSNNQSNIFPNLTTVGNGIFVQNNTFQQVGGFGSFTTMTAGSIQFSGNAQLQNISGFNSITNLATGNLAFAVNNNLETINAFSNLQIANGLLIRNTKLINLNFLSSLQTNNGQLSVESNSLLTNATFPNIVNHNFSNGTVGSRYVRFINNTFLTTIGNINFNGSSTCEALTINGSLINSIGSFGTSSFSVNGEVFIANNSVTNLNFLNQLTSCGGLRISQCTQITSLIGLANLTTINGQASNSGLTIFNNINLTSLNGLNTTNLAILNQPVVINGNTALTNINALSSIPVSGVSTLTISSNGQLATCASTWLCDYVATGKPLTVTGNAVGCESVSVINSVCNPCPSGNVTVTTQAQLNALAGCTTINGNLQINGSGITDFTSVNNITTVTGELSISNISTNLNNVFPNLTSAGAIAIINNSFTTFNGFNSLTGNLNYINISFNNNLTSFSGFNTFSGTTGLDIRENPNLSTMNALGSVTQISNFYLKNVALANLNFLSSLVTVNGYFIVEYCSSLNSFSPSINKTLLLNNSTFRLTSLPLLTNLNGLTFNSANCSDITIMDCGSLTSITPMSGISGAMTGGFLGNIFIQNNDALTSLNGLQNITSARSLFILDNQLLTNLSGLNSFSSTTDAVGISDNPSLTSLNGLNNLVAVGYPPSIGSNSMLTDISALNTLNLASTVNMASGQLNITNNSNLAICAVPWVCNYMSNANVVKNINSNAVGCESVAVVNTACTALSTSDFDLNEISLYPNPTNFVFNLEIPNEVVKQVEIYDLSGKKLLKSNQHQIDVSSLATGIYMVQIQTESGKTGVSKLVKK